LRDFHVRASQPAANLNRALSCSNDADALACLLLAAEQGCIRAKFLAGLAYHLGLGVSVDYERAAHWYRQAACAADPHAITNLGVMSVLGQGAPSDDLEAYTWLQSAAGLGHVWLRPAVAVLERRISSGGTSAAASAAQILASVSPEVPDLGPCTLPACDPSRCKVT
jgi:TPR repeat protein